MARWRRLATPTGRRAESRATRVGWPWSVPELGHGRSLDVTIPTPKMNVRHEGKDAQADDQNECRDQRAARRDVDGVSLGRHGALRVERFGPRMDRTAWSVPRPARGLPPVISGTCDGRMRAPALSAHERS